MLEEKDMSRRQATRVIAQGAAGLLLAPVALGAETPEKKASTFLQRPIPSSSESLPVIGLGTWQAFDVGPASAERQPLEEVLALFAKLGGRVVDSSPMYGRAEQVIGEIATKLDLQKALFLATKVWTTGRQQGIDSMEKSLAKLGSKRIDLMQVHNLVDAPTQLATLRDWKEKGRVRYLGITHYNSSAYDEVAKLLRSEKLDFVQINYSLLESEAERRNPAARAGSRCCRNRESPVWRRQSFRTGAPEAAAGMGRGIRLPFLGPVPLEMDHRASRRDLCDPRDQQGPSSGRQYAGRPRSASRREDAETNGRRCSEALASQHHEHVILRLA